MPTLFNQTWQDNAGDTVSASDLNSHAAEHSNALFDVEESGTVIGGVGRDQPINVTGSGATVSKSSGEIIVDVTDTDTQLSNEQVEDIVAGRLSGGSNVTVTHDDPNDTITVDATDTNTDTRVETQAGGTTEYSDTSVVNFDTSSDISVTDNGSGKITVAASGGGGGSVDTLSPTSASTAATNNGTSGALAVGGGSQAGVSGDSGTAIGQNAISEGFSVAIGNGATIQQGSADFAPKAVLISSHGASISNGENGFFWVGDADSISDGSVVLNSSGLASVSGTDNVVVGKRAESTGGDSVAIGESSRGNTQGVAIGQNASLFAATSIAIGKNVSVSTPQVARIGEGENVGNGRNPSQLVFPVSDTIADTDLNNGEVAIRADSLSSPSQIEFRLKDTNGTLHTFTAT